VFVKSPKIVLSSRQSLGGRGGIPLRRFSVILWKALAKGVAERLKLIGHKDRESSAVVAALQEKPDELTQFIQRMESHRKELEQDSEFDGWLARLYTAIGDKDQALRCLERAYQQHSEVIQILKVSPEFDPLRSDPRFQHLVRRAGLPP
jgi:hypothetical protein